MPSCCAPGCNRNERNSPRHKFHPLPWDKPIIKVWLSKLKLDNPPAQGAKICDDHFEERSFKNHYYFITG